MELEGLLKTRQDEITDLIERFGHRKLNLVHGTATVSNEGIWVVPKDEAARTAMVDDSSIGVSFRAYITNDPMGFPNETWGGLSWGAEVIGVSNGENRPFATVAAQTDAKTNAENIELRKCSIEFHKKRMQ
jgi:hypothetical protein